MTRVVAVERRTSSVIYEVPIFVIRVDIAFAPFYKLWHVFVVKRGLHLDVM